MLFILPDSNSSGIKPGALQATTDLRALRRTIPLGLVRLVDGCGEQAAATALGVPPDIAHDSAYRTATNLGSHVGPQLRSALVEYADALETQPPTNWGHRRRYFTSEWLLPDPYWEDLKRIVTAKRVTNKPATLEARHRAYSVWIWSLVTSGDPTLAPMIEAPADRPDAPGHGTLQTLWKMTKRRNVTTPLHKRIVEDVATDLSAKIDNSVRDR